MTDIASRITGVALLIILFVIENSVPAEVISGCDVFEDNFRRLKADCRAKGISKIPTNLGPEIKMLDVSDNTNISKLLPDDLKNYPKLWGLNIGRLPLTEFPAGFFQYTPVIKMINMSRTRITNMKEIPASITILNYTYSPFEYIDLSHLVHLQKLLLRYSTSLKKFPTLYSLAPLDVIDTKNCSLIEADYSQIAVFCKLHFLGIHSTDLTDEKYLMKCCRLRKWPVFWNMTGYQLQNCTRRPNFSCKSLNLTLDEDSVKLYKDCYFRNGLSKFLVLLSIVLIFVIVIVGLIIASTWYYYHHFDIPFWDTHHGKKTASVSTSWEVEAEEEIEMNNESSS